MSCIDKFVADLTVFIDPELKITALADCLATPNSTGHFPRLKQQSSGPLVLKGSLLFLPKLESVKKWTVLFRLNVTCKGNGLIGVKAVHLFQNRLQIKPDRDKRQLSQQFWYINKRSVESTLLHFNSYFRDLTSCGVDAQGLFENG